MVFERFTEKAIRSIMLAQEEARRLGHNFVGTEQVLLGVIREQTGIAARALAAMGVELEKTRIEIERIIGRGSGFVAIEIPFTPRAKRMLEIAWNESRKLGTDYIGTEHLLLAILGESGGVAVRVLDNLGIDFDKVREQVVELMAEDKAGKGKKDSSARSDADEVLSSLTGISRINRIASLGKVSDSLIDSVFEMLSQEGQALASQLREVLRDKESALRTGEFEKASALLNKQMDIMTKLRQLSELENV